MWDSLLAFKASPLSRQDTLCIDGPPKLPSFRHHHRRDKSKAARPEEVYQPERADASKGRLDANTLSDVLKGFSQVVLAGTAGRWGSLGMSTR